MLPLPPQAIVMARIDDEVKAKFQNNKQRLIANLVFTGNWFQNLVAAFLKPYGLSLQQNNILLILRGAKDWVSMTDIKDRMVEKAPNATRLSDKLLNKGLVERRRSDHDRRVVYLRITKEGLAVLKKIDEDDNLEHLAFMGRITDKEAQQASDVLDKMRG